MGATDNMKSYMKLYRERNKERLNKKARQYHQKRKAEYTERVNCICGGHFQKWNKAIHEKGKKHNIFCKKNGFKYFEWEEKKGKDILDKNDLNIMSDYIYGEFNDTK